MKKILVMVMVGAVLWTEQPAHALTMCATNWLDAWRTATNTQIQAGATIQQGRAFTRQGVNGTWVVGSSHGGAGRQSVSGISQCTTVEGATNPFSTHSEFTLGQAPASGGVFCWCRMTSPALGSTWVFITTDPACATHCASHCANGVQNNTAFRTAVLATP